MLAPVIFVSHGSPMMAIEAQGTVSDQWKAIAPYLTDVNAMVVISPHWATSNATGITGSAEPSIIHDFYGFPDELYEVSQPVTGDADLAAQVATLITNKGYVAQVDMQQPIDHGAWVPLRHLDPTGQIPVVHLSVDMQASAQTLYELGQVLASLRQEGIAIVASGAITHNLRHVFTSAPPQSLAYVANFRDWVRDAVSENHIDDLLNIKRLNADFSLAHPTDDHFRPLYFALGAVAPADQLTVLDGGIYDRCLAMENYLWQGA